MPKNTSTLAPFDTPVVDLSEPGVCVHLGELQLCLSARSLWQGSVADDVAECLSESLDVLAQTCDCSDS